MKSSTPLTQGNSSTLNNTKYQKAIKQINKLIGINTSIKKQMIALQQKYDSLRNQFNQLQQKYAALQNENNQLIQFHHQRNITKMGRNVQSYQQPNSQNNIQVNINQNMVNTSQKRNRENYSPLSLPNKQLENTGTISEYIDNKKKLQQLQQKLLEKQERIQTMMKQLAEKSKQNAQLYQNFVQKINTKNKQRSENQLKNQQIIAHITQQKSYLQIQLQKAEQKIKKITLQYESLKNKSIKLIQSGESAVSNIKSLNMVAGKQQQSPLYINIGGKNKQQQQPYSSISPNLQSLHTSAQKTQRNDPFTQYYLKKVKDLQAELVKNKKQFTDKKSKYKSHICKLKQQISSKDETIIQINNFIAKQQAFIQDFVIKQNMQSSKSKSKITMQNINNKNKQFFQNQIAESYHNPIYTKQNLFGLELAKHQSFGSHASKDSMNRNRINSPQRNQRINTIQSQQYTVNQSQLHNMNFGFGTPTNKGSQIRRTFVEGVKHYRK